MVRPDQQLLTGLAASVEGAAHLGTAEGAVVEHAAVFAGEWHTLGDHLVDDVDRDLGEAMHIGFARSEVAALNRVVEQAEHRVAITLVVLGSVDTALSRDRVGPTW